MSFKFNNSYAELPDRFYAKLPPAGVSAPGLVKVNHDLAAELGLDAEFLESADGIAILSGNRVPAGAEPLAMAYAGHQFGNWVSQLGDGRALLLGEIVDRRGVRRDLQLKGSGPTPFSRRGDGRSWLGPVLREYLVSEAMHALGIPTTRALAAVTTGDPVYREQVLPGAVLTRIATSHIRIGTFQYFYARSDTKALTILTEHLIARLKPELAAADNPVLSLFNQVVRQQAALIAGWMGVGFIHGVMNTDNMSLAGETIDYGPCAFMDRYDPGKVFSSIDHAGRYAYSNQPGICHWNLAQLATTLVPVLDADRDRAIGIATDAVNGFQHQFRDEWSAVFCRKLGLSPEQNDAALAADFLDILALGQADFTIAFRKLSCLGDDPGDGREFCNYLGNSDRARAWLSRWRSEVCQGKRPVSERQVAMKMANPAVIPRNHLVEQAIGEAVAGDYSLFHDLNLAWSTPYSDRPETLRFQLSPAPEQIVCHTFCGT